MRHLRRIMLDGVAVEVEQQGEKLLAPDGRSVDAATATHLTPVLPTKVICVHFTFPSRIDELKLTVDTSPTFFHKPTSSLNAHNGSVVRPAGCKYLNFEGEIAAVIGRTCRNVSREEVSNYIRGYTLANDFALHDFKDTDLGAALRAKGADTLSPIGPGVVEGWDFRGKMLRTRVNGVIMQEGNTDEMLWDMHYIVADLARMITLNPGDVILTGTPANSRPVEPGDVVAVEADGLGELVSRIVAGNEVETSFGAQPGDSDAIRAIAGV